MPSCSEGKLYILKLILIVCICALIVVSISALRVRQHLAVMEKNAASAYVAGWRAGWSAALPDHPMLPESGDSLSSDRAWEYGFLDDRGWPR